MANAEFNYTDTIEQIKTTIENMSASAFQQDELRELIEALIDPDHIGSSKGKIVADEYDNLNAAITSLKSAVDGAFDKTSDDDSNITVAASLTNSSSTDLQSVLDDLDDAMVTTDTNSDTAAEISINDSGEYTDETDVENALQEIYEDKETIESNRFDKTSDGDTDITNFTALDDEITVNSGDTLKDVISAINTALGGKPNSDTDTNTAAGISIADSGGYTSEDYVEGALQEIYDVLGTVDPASDFDGTYNYLEDLSTLKAALSQLDSKIYQNYLNISGAASNLYREVLWAQGATDGTDGSDPSITEYTTSSGDKEILRKIAIDIRDVDNEITLQCKTKVSTGDSGYVGLQILGSNVETININFDSYLEKLVTLSLDNVIPGVQELDIIYKAVTGTLTAKDFTIIKGQ